jgi:hypothetical protein
MDKHRHNKIVVTLVFFMVIFQVKIKYKFLPSFTNKHKSSTQKKRKMKKNQDAKFSLGFALIP